MRTMQYDIPNLTGFWDCIMITEYTHKEINVLLQEVLKDAQIKVGFDCSSSVEILQRITADILPLAEEDLSSYVQRDPALEGSYLLALDRSGPFRAVLSYRMSHRLWFHEDQTFGRKAAYAIYQQARVLTGIEIHPGATIGTRCVIDHGSNTVIGSTVRIGTDAYILNGVTLGARGISNNNSGRRHPTIGNRVQIGSCARVLGNINIGDDVFVGPLACVTTDVPCCIKAQFKFMKMFL
jgi:serine O-acetyltransferase